MSKKVYLVNVPRTHADKQVYMQSFCEAWVACGGMVVERKGWLHSRMAKNALKTLALIRWPVKRGGKVYIVCSRGGHLLKAAVPFLFLGDIIPMLWDCWPDTWDRLEHDLRLMRCRLCFMTASDAAKEMARRLPQIRFVHIPEGIAVEDYTEGEALSKRSIDVFELGDKHNYFHKKLIDSRLSERYRLVYHIPMKRKGLQLVFEQWGTFTQKIADTKITVSFPRCMRDPRGIGCVDTLTMRYWEGMLSRCIILGHCPQELIDMIGYNPVVEADFVDPCQQIEHILQHLLDYQPLVDKNRATACRHAPWKRRIPIIFEEIEKLI